MRLRNRGFVGPRYRGLLGRLRFAFQYLVFRTDAILVAERHRPIPPLRAAEPTELRLVERWEDLGPLVETIDRSYSPGYAAKWKPAFGWGEQLYLAFEGGELVAFRFIQVGHDGGFPTHFCRLLTGEARILRGGVLPAVRATGVNTRFHMLIIRDLFRRGIRTVFADCTIDNVPSMRSLLRGGYYPVGAIRVGGALVGDLVRWVPLVLPPDVVSAGVGGDGSWQPFAPPDRGS